MTKNLNTADRITKLTLSLFTLVLYFIGAIQGPFAQALMILSVSVILLYFMQLAVTKSD